jgi:hypothetical protein
LSPSDTPPGPPPDGDDLLSQAYFRETNVAEEVAQVGDPGRSILGKLAKCFAALLLVFVLLDVAVRKLWPQEELLTFMDGEVAFYTMKLKHYLAQPAPDVLFLGSSRTRMGVDAGLFSAEVSKKAGRPIRAFNLGLDGASVTEFHSLVSTHLPEKTPPYVVICISGLEIVQRYDFHYAPRFLWGFSNFVEYFSSTSYDDFDVDKVDYFLESVVCSFWYLFENRDPLRKMLNAYGGVFLGLEGAEGKLKYMEKLGQRKVNLSFAESGYWAVPSENTFDKLLAARPGKYKMKRFFDSAEEAFGSNENVALLERVILDLQSRGSQVLLAEIPPSPHAQKEMPEEAGVDFRRWWTRKAQAMGVPFITSPPDETKLSDQMYFDISHLSDRGAWLYTFSLAERICATDYFERQGP